MEGAEGEEQKAWAVSVARVVFKAVTLQQIAHSVCLHSFIGVHWPNFKITNS